MLNAGPNSAIARHAAQARWEANNKKLKPKWGKTDKALCKVRMLPGEAHRERVLTPEEEVRYLNAAREWSTLRRPLLPDVAVILLDCGLRPEECFRLRWDNISPAPRFRWTQICDKEYPYVQHQIFGFRGRGRSPEGD